MPTMDKEGAELLLEEKIHLLRQLVETGEGDLVFNSSGKLEIVYASDRSKSQKDLHTSHGVREQKTKSVECQDTQKAVQLGMAPPTSSHHRSSPVVPDSQLPSPDSYCRGRKKRADGKAVKETAQEIDHAVKDNSQEKPDMEKDAGPEDSLHKGEQAEMERTGGIKPEGSEAESEEEDDYDTDLFAVTGNATLRSSFMADALRKEGLYD